ncbi:hypothetical protein GCM10010412_006130 [Nonomuraea recticatena]|uniref:Uncharacterized protein n=1 Tax=Nonomuraea recticatena TaxID=46178 RepID=A0ABN3R5Z3_9ACTN
MEDGQSQDRHRLIEVEVGADSRVIEDLPRLPQVACDGDGPAVVLQQGAGVDQDERVVVDVDDLASSAI